MIRPAILADADAWLHIRNDPEAMFWSAQRTPIPLDGHRAWFERSLAGSTEGLYVVEGERSPDGTVPEVLGYGRIQQVGLVSFGMAPTERGRGYGTEMLAALAHEARANNVQTLLAVVHPSNIASMRAFMRAGYTPHPVNAGVLQRRLAPA